MEDVDTEDITVGNVLIMAVPFLGQGNHLLKDQANHHKIRILVEGKSSFWCVLKEHRRNLMIVLLLSVDYFVSDFIFGIGVATPSFFE